MTAIVGNTDRTDAKSLFGDKLPYEINSSDIRNVLIIKMRDERKLLTDSLKDVIELINNECKAITELDVYRNDIMSRLAPVILSELIDNYGLYKSFEVENVTKANKDYLDRELHKLEQNNLNYSQGIYKITNITTGKIYIGKSEDIKIRWYTHKGLLKNNKHENTGLQEDFNKYGETNFHFDKIEYVEFKEELFDRERQQIINALDRGEDLYNLALPKSDSNEYNYRLLTKEINAIKERLECVLKGAQIQ